MNAVVSLGAEPTPGPDLAVLDDPIEQQRFTRWSEAADGQRQAESSFQLSGMYCAACAGIIESALAAVPGVEEARVNSASRRAQVRWDPAQTSPSRLVQAVRGAGYDAVPDAAASARELRRKERRQALWRVFVASFCAMQVMMFATPSYVAHGNELAPDLRQLLNWGSWVVTLPVLLFSAGPFFKGAWHSLRRRKIGMDVPVALGLLVTFVASSGATFDPSGPFGHEVYFDSLTMFVSFLLGGRYLEMSARHRAAEALEETLSGMPETALRLKTGDEVETVSVLRLVRGDRVRVPVGAAFPADGRLERGQTEADESLLTGESRPVVKRAGDEVVAGSINLGAPATMQVERVGADTRHEAIVAMMRDAMSQRPALARWADAWAAPFLWTVLALALGAGLVWSWVDPSRAVWVMVSVLIVTCPCALSLAAPSALVAAAGALARRGVMVQRLDALEALASMTRLYTDKTGTLTEERPQWSRTVLLADAGDAQALAEQAASLARWSSHPLSQALAARGAASAGMEWSQVQEQAGAGLEGEDDRGVRWRLGSPAWVAGEGALSPSAGQEAGQAVYFGPAGQPLARFEFDEQLRPDAAQALQALAADGVQVSLLSGDDTARVGRLAASLGLAEFHGDATPAIKRDVLAQAQADGAIVGMVGDGINDAPVLARANVSFAMGQGALVSRSHADAVIVSNRLGDLVLSRRLARQAMTVVRQNLIWAALYNSACIPLAMLGYLPPWAAGLGMALSSLLVVGNAWRIGR